MTDCARIAKDYIKTLKEDKITELLEQHLSEKQFFIHLREALIKLYYISNL